MPLTDVANSFRQLPSHWICKDGLDVTDDFINYAKPLIGKRWPAIELEDGTQRFARLQLTFVEKKCPSYIPVGFRDVPT